LSALKLESFNKRKCCQNFWAFWNYDVWCVRLS